MTSRRMFLSTLLCALVLASTTIVGTGGVEAAPRAPAVGRSDEASFETVAALDELTGAHATIFRLYHAFFGRDPDVRGALYWVERRDRCVTPAAIADQFAASGEFARRYGSVDTGGFVELVYANVLDREPDPGGHRYWTGLVDDGTLTRGGVMLHVSLSAEFTTRHPYPSDGVADRPCRAETAAPTERTAAIGVSGPMAEVPEADLTLMYPAIVVERVGFHESSHPGALAMTATGTAEVTATVLASRGRGTAATGAADVPVHPLVPITAPIAGTVARAGDYVLYCRYEDGFVVINPDAAPHLEVKVLHLQGVAVEPGDRVAVGDLIASGATPFPFLSQIDDLTAEPSWPHVHLEVVDPSVPRKRSVGGSC